MKKMLNKFGKENISFFAALLLFAVAAIFRFYDEKLWKHKATFPFMKDLNVAFMAMLLFFVLLFVFYGVCIWKTENRKTMRYLCVFLSVFAFPIFLPKYYFGSLDMYAWMLVVLTCIFIVLNKKILALLSALVADIGVIASIVLNGWNPDVRETMTVLQFVVAVALLSPYLLIAFSFFKGILKHSTKKTRILWCVIFMCALPNGIINVVAGDYARALVYTFMYFIILVMSLMASGVKTVEDQMELTKMEIKKWVPIPAVVIAYPLLIITFWIAGPITLFTEVFTGK